MYKFKWKYLFLFKLWNEKCDGSRSFRASLFSLLSQRDASALAPTLPSLLTIHLLLTVPYCNPALAEPYASTTTTNIQRVFKSKILLFVYMYRYFYLC